jgi:drug/metabolite transporter (DMT)-like permease
LEVVATTVMGALVVSSKAISLQQWVGMCAILVGTYAVVPPPLAT